MKIPLYARILIAMAIAVPVAYWSKVAGMSDFWRELIVLPGDLFIRFLFMTIVPLVFASIVSGLAGMKSTAQLSRLGSLTIVFYLISTALAILVGLFFANFFLSDVTLPAEKTGELAEKFRAGILAGTEAASRSWGDKILDIFPKNPVQAASEGNMLQLVIFSAFFGAGSILLPNQQRETMVTFFTAVTGVMLKIIEGIMWFAPLGVFSLIFKSVFDLGLDMLFLLGQYAFVVVAGLLFHTFFVYGVIIHFFSHIKVHKFFRTFFPVQLLAFSSASSAVTLPFNMDVMEKKMGVREEVVSFVLPLGATLNMDGTALYLGIAASFIAGIFGVELTFMNYIQILGTTLIASIGTAAVPGASLVMLIIILNSVNVPPEGIAMTLAIDRILDMLRTSVNVTGDAVAAAVVANKSGLTNEVAVEQK